MGQLLSKTGLYFNRDNCGMTRRHILTERRRSALFDLPTDELSLLRHYTLGDADLGHIQERRRPENRLGFAQHVQNNPFCEIAISLQEDHVQEDWSLGRRPSGSWTSTVSSLVRLALNTTRFVPPACRSDGKRIPLYPAEITISDNFHDAGIFRSIRAILR